MDKQQRASEKRFKKVYFWELSVTARILILLACMLAVFVVVFTMLRVNSLSKEVVRLREELANSTAITSGDFIDELSGKTIIAAKAITESEKEEYIGRLEQGLQSMRDKYIYFFVEESEDSYVTMLYNPNREAITQISETGHISIYRNDQKAIRYTDYIDFGYDSDVITLMENALQMAKDGEAEVYSANTDENNAGAEAGFSEIEIDIQGWDKIERLYGIIDEDFGKVMRTQMEESLAIIESENNIETGGTLNFRFTYFIDSTNTIQAFGVYMYFGEVDPLEVTWGDLVVSWKVDGYTVVYDWELKDEWYTMDWDNIDAEEAEALLESQYSDVTDMLSKYATDNGYDITPSKDGESLDDIIEHYEGDGHDH